MSSWIGRRGSQSNFLSIVAVFLLLLSAEGKDSLDYMWFSSNAERTREVSCSVQRSVTGGWRFDAAGW